MGYRIVSLFLLVSLTSPPSAAQHELWNYETPHVHPLDRTPDGARLLAVNTPDNRLEVFASGFDALVHEASIPVGLEPVSVRARTSTEAWVVNLMSDTVAIVDLATGQTIRVLQTDDEPCDVVFANGRAFVTCSQANTLLVFDAADPGAEPVRIPILGEEPRALAVDPSGERVFVAVFASGNATTILGGGFALEYPPIAANSVSDPDGPYGGVNPPPNSESTFDPPMSDGLPAPPPVSLIVRRDEQGFWRDDNGIDWTSFVSGPLAGRSGRISGWELLDHDVAVIDTETLEVKGYAGGMLNLCMGLAVNPGTGAVTVVGLDAINEIRFESNLNGIFVRALMGSFPPDETGDVAIADLNPHLDYTEASLPQEERELSIGDPRAIVWSADGTQGYVAGMGSNNIVVIDASGARRSAAIEVGEGPTGLVLDDETSRLYVLNKFEATISVVDVASRVETQRVPFFDPSPEAIRLGRRHLYDTHATSGTGLVSCAACHIDARTDRLAWDLGNPAGQVQAIENANIPTGMLEDWHPMKGPMLTQTLQDIIGKEPLHWRGDKPGLEDFNGAYESLLGDDSGLTPEEMQELEDFLATIRIGPNPYRNLDNTLPTALPLPGQYTSGAIGPPGLPLGTGNAQRGLELFAPDEVDSMRCATCHALPSGVGSDYRWSGNRYVPFPVGDDGEHHANLVHLDGFTNHTLVPPQLRTLYERVGFDLRQSPVFLGFGFLHDGSIDSLSSFLAPFGSVGDLLEDQDVADLVAFLMCFSGSDLPEAARTDFLRPPGTPSNDTHAAVGRQAILTGGLEDAAQLPLLGQLHELALEGAIGLVAKGRRAGVVRGFYLVAPNLFQSDRRLERIDWVTLRQGLGSANAITLTAVPKASEVRIGVDRDSDGVFDRDELDAGTDPSDPTSFPCLYAPYPPDGLAAESVRRHRVDLSWEDNSFSEEGFSLQVRPLGQAGFSTIVTVGPNITSAAATGLAADTLYQFRVVAFNCAGDSSGPMLILPTAAAPPHQQAGDPRGPVVRSP